MRAGRHPRFEELYRAHHRDLLAFIRRRSRPDVAEDVLAETFVVAWRRLADIPAEERSWLFGVARNVIRTTERSEARRASLYLRVASADDGVVAPFDEAIATRADLTRAWNDLSEGEREVIALVAWDGLSHGEAAQVLGITSAAFAVRLFRARRRLLHLIERGRRP